MRIVLIGAVDFSRHCLELLLTMQAEVAGVVTTSRPEAYSDFADLLPLTDANAIPAITTDNINSDDILQWISERKPEVIFCFGWSQLIREPLLELAPKGVIGAHPALIPRNRGRHPLIWAKALGLKTSGLTFFQMDQGADSGPIVSQKNFEILFTDTAFDLYQKIKKMAERQLPEVVQSLQDPDFRAQRQDLTQSNLWRKRSRLDGIIDWRMSSEAIINLIRALTRPYPGATFSHSGEEFILWAAEPYPVSGRESWAALDHEPGKCVWLQETNGKVRPIIRTYDGYILLTEWQGNLRIQPEQYLD
ncbi:formyltransferase family protein [Thiomicrorhabdus xiamenensis]|uniref:Methionyl-tRNA formyltransferase n=1 Tax=Thiomicrorhabdus xiamenensis TaxID=2739063 RepID=A0A7D4NRI4_9GAMM|nr:formyltransferase family protein [Thiomicrorhabdus xiamenensis]QKI89570.1 methionyl-tRNA formyltransferase [Thiomicrorhabdus xiamenensis]